MNCKRLILALPFLFALVACKTTEGLSCNPFQHEKNRMVLYHSHDVYLPFWKKRTITAIGADCPSNEYGLCFTHITEMINNDEPICIAMNENNRIMMAIPQYNNGQTINPQYEMFDGLDALSITDSLVLWDEETLEALDFTTPVAVLPDDYRITRSHDTLYLDLQTSPVNLERKVCAFFYYDSHTLQSVRFQDYYEGYLGASDIMTGIVSEVSEEYLILTFLYELNVSDALNEVRYISDNRIFSLREDITCNDYSICRILGFSDFFRLLHGEYEIEMIDGGFRVKIPYIIQH